MEKLTSGDVELREGEPVINAPLNSGLREADPNYNSYVYDQPMSYTGTVYITRAYFALSVSEDLTPPVPFMSPFKRIDKGHLGEEVYIVVEHFGSVNNITVQIKEKEPLLSENDILPVLQGDTETTSITLQPMEREGIYCAKISLRPKSDEDMNRWSERLRSSEANKSLLSIEVNAEAENNLLFRGTDLTNFFLNLEGKWFEIDACECCAKMSRMTLEEDGFITGMDYVKNRQESLEHGELKSIEAIVLHRTDSDNVVNAMNASAGTHFYVAKDGTVYQAASLSKKTWHVGTGLYSKQKDETGEGEYENVWPHKERGAAELKKSYPDRYPINSDSVGIEVAGRWHESTGEDAGKYTSGKYAGEVKGEWDELTEEQKKSVVCLCRVLKELYSLSNDDIYAHDDIKPKTKGEGSSYINDVISELE